MRRFLLAALFYVSGLPGCLAQGFSAYDLAGSDFEQKVIADSAKQPVVVMFRSGACAPCNKMIIEAPRMAFAAFAGRATFHTVNIDVERTLAEKYQVTALPRIVVFKDGSVVASRVGEADRDPLFQFFAAQAPPEVKQAYQKPPQVFEGKRPPGAELKTIGSWQIERGADGIAYALSAFKYLHRLDETKAGPWTVTGSAALSLRYDAAKQETIWDVTYSQESTRPAGANEHSVLQSSGAKVVVEHPGGPVFMRLDGEQVAQLPDPLMLQAAETAKTSAAPTNAARAPSQSRRRLHVVVANQYFRSIRLGNISPAQFEKIFVESSKIQFAVSIDGHHVDLCEIALEDTQKALVYLKGERTYAWRKQNMQNIMALPR